MRTIPDEAGVPARRRPLAAALLGLTLVSLAGCGVGTSSSTAGGGTAIAVVAAENFWGSIAAQLGGAHVQVTSLITNPETDPHSYEPSAQDGRSIATARYVIENGAGYDDAWAPKLIEASANPDRMTLNVGDLNGVKAGDNQHMWYSPTYVMKVIDRITADLQKLDPPDADFFNQQHQSYLSAGLQEYNQLRAGIKAKYAGTPVGATESIFAYMSDDLGLRLLTPREYLKAISEGSDPTAGDKATVDQQIGQKQIAVLIFNSQNATTDVQASVDKAKAQGIPTPTITETLSPASASFQDWQSGQLRQLEQALRTATGR